MSRAQESERSFETSSTRTDLSSDATLVGTIVFVAAFLTACAPNPRVVMVPPTGAVLRVGPDAEARVYVQNDDGTWELSANEVPIAEGWYLVDSPDAIP